MEIYIDNSMLARVLGAIQQSHMVGKKVTHITLDESEMEELLVDLKEKAPDRELPTMDMLRNDDTLMFNDVEVGLSGVPPTSH